ncbi:MAG: hypothetical protein K9M49_05780 [Candidatus Marinimicrobia bacterium]|nr:hypothetical protein [Candidatus Neomarinimicrobiota bacterium]
MSAMKPSYGLNELGEFVIDQYNAAKPFSSFFPGIAGKMGIPLWAFYVNRGQCVCSMGVQDKDNPIMEFLPANWAYQKTSTQGFRTFIKLPDNADIPFYEPFQNHYRDRDLLKSQRMRISPSHLILEEQNDSLGMHFRVEYYTVPEDRYAGFIRKLSIQNTGKAEVKITGLDGLPLIIPHGIVNDNLKQIRRLMEAFVEVINYDRSAPMFKTKVKPADRPDVEMLDAANFYLAFEENADGKKQIKPIVDPQKIFGPHADYSFPEAFLNSDLDALYQDQILENRLPSAMAPFQQVISPGETYVISSLAGHTESQEALNSMLSRIAEDEYLEQKIQSSKHIVDELTQKNLVLTSDPVFDMYTRQNFLDNVLRGGFPYTFKGEKAQSVLHLYSRKHGDLERDYNFFRVTPSYYSQGNGNFRDVNQNRRSDLFFNPDVKTSNLDQFVNLIQLDGFNPLVIKEISYRVKDPDNAKKVLQDYFDEAGVDAVITFMQELHTPGELIAQLEASDLTFESNADAFLGDFLSVCYQSLDTDHAEGYWSDHWTYNLDLLHNYLSDYPENAECLLFEKTDYTYHDSAYTVLPRADKYVIWEGKTMQLDAVQLNKHKAALMETRDEDHDKMRTQFGSGPVYQTTLMNKMLCLLTNKIASLDPSGIGVEMETDKPNWYDALNGLPGIMGSSLSETVEVKRHAEYLLKLIDATENIDRTVAVFEELHQFMNTIQNLIDSEQDGYAYWDQASSAKEAFREKTILGISGHEFDMSLDEIVSFLHACVKKINAGIKKSWDEKGEIPKTYFSHSVSEFEMIEVQDESGETGVRTNGRGFPCFKAKKFELVPLPHFLEGPVHYLRALPSKEKAQKLVNNIRKSGLYDPVLKMYKVNASLADQPMEIGRARVFSPGWFENESIWLHMEYKYMLEMLRNELYDDFFAEFKNVFIPFLDAEKYGRSILENSSFLVSSANPDPGLHGAGFVARLSGATAEFIHILSEMTVGSQPFSLDAEGNLRFSLEPALPAWLFTEGEQELRVTAGQSDQKIPIPANSFSFMFLSDILITYNNPGRMNTFGPDRVHPVRWRLTDQKGAVVTAKGAFLDSQYAEMIRARDIVRIEVDLDV